MSEHGASCSLNCHELGKRQILLSSQTSPDQQSGTTSSVENMLTRACARDELYANSGEICNNLNWSSFILTIILHNLKSSYMLLFLIDYYLFLLLHAFSKAVRSQWKSVERNTSGSTVSLTKNQMGSLSLEQKNPTSDLKAEFTVSTNLAVGQVTLFSFCSHQNSWDLWKFIPLKNRNMV